MSNLRGGHLVERAVERMGALGAPGGPPRMDLPPEPPLFPRPPEREPGSSPPDNPATPAADTAAATPIGLDVMEKAGLAVAGTRRSRVAEEWGITSGTVLRALRARPQTPIGQGGAPNLLMITSSKPNEGKSFSALNLAGSLTMNGRSEVLLLDIDSKPGALSESLGVNEHLGLFDLVADPSLRVRDLILPTAVKGLTVLPIGRAARDGPGSIERTLTRSVVTAIEQVAQRFPNHVVILDTAPCLATSDASTLAPAVGHIAMIVEAQRTQRDDLLAALDLLRACPNIMLILNKVRQITTHAFGTYHYYDA